MKNNKMLAVALMGFAFGFVSQVKAFEFDLLNKTGMPVEVTVTDRGTNKVIMDGRPVGNREPCHITDKNALPAKVLITVNEGGGYESSYEVTVEGKATCYVTYGEKNGTNKIYPQTGKLGGWSKTTETGHPLNSATNVTDRDIRDQ